MFCPSMISMILCTVDLTHNYEFMFFLSLSKCSCIKHNIYSCKISPKHFSIIQTKLFYDSNSGCLHYSTCMFLYTSFNMFLCFCITKLICFVWLNLKDWTTFFRLSRYSLRISRQLDLNATRFDAKDNYSDPGASLLSQRVEPVYAFSV